MHFRSRAAIVAALTLLAVAPAHAHEGWGIVVTRDGDVWVTDIPANAIWRLRAGRLERVATGVHSHALVLDRVGSVVGTHAHATESLRGVWRIDRSGARSAVLPLTRDLPIGLQSFLLARDGSIISASAHEGVVSPGDTRTLHLLRRWPDGTYTRVAGGGPVGHADGAGDAVRFTGIDGMAWAARGDILLADGPYVRRVAPDGRVVTLGGRAVTDPRMGEDLLGLALGSGGQALVADFAGARLLDVSPAGDVRTRYEAPRPWSPSGVTSVADTLYLLEHLRAPLGVLAHLGLGPYLRIRRLPPGGEATTLATVWGRNTRTAALVVAGFVALVAITVAFRRRRRARRT